MRVDCISGRMARRPVLIAAVLAVLFLLLPALAQEAAKPVESYRLGIGDEVEVTVSPTKRFDCVGAVLPDGTLRLKIGKFKALGLTIDELEEQIKKKLEDELDDPDVTVGVKPAPPPPPKIEKPEKPMKPLTVTVVGAVTKPGEYELEPGLRVRKVLDRAGGTLKDADLANVLIIHSDLTKTIVDLSTEEQVLSPAHNLLLKSGDSIDVRAVPAKIKVMETVSIGGQVLNADVYELKPQMTIDNLIVAAGKVTPLADLENVQFRRSGEAIRTINLVEQYKLGLNGKVFLKNGDEVFIPELKNVVYVIGMVAKGGPKGYVPGQTVREFFISGNQDVAQSLNPALVNLGEVEFIRYGEKPVKIDIRAIIKDEKNKGNVQLATGDIIFLPPVKQKGRGFLDYLGQLGPLSFLFGGF